MSQKNFIAIIAMASILLYGFALAGHPKPPVPSGSAMEIFEESYPSVTPKQIIESLPQKETVEYSFGVDRLIMDQNPDPSKASNACNETFIAVDPANPAVFVSSCNFWLTSQTTPAGNNYALGYAYTQNGGTTWQNSPAVIPYYSGHNRAFDPIVAFSGSGENAHSAYFGGASIKNPGGDARIVITRVDNMDTTPVVNSTKNVMSPFPTNFSFWDKPWLAVDNVDASPYKGNIYMCAYPYFTTSAYNNDPTLSGLYFSRSADRGETWSAIKLLTNDDPNSAFSSYNQIAIGPSGEVYVCYENLGFIGGGIWFEKSTDAGDTWSTETLAYAIQNVGNDPYLELPGKDGAADYSDFGYFKTGANTRPFNANEGQRALSLPAMACDNSPTSPYKGNIYISWAGDPQPNDDTSDLGDIFFIKSTDGGNTWSSPTRVNDDLTTNDQYFPAVATSPDGRIFVLFYDSRYDAGNDKIDVTVATSYDGGETFPEQTRITDISFSPRFSSGLTMFIGDYNGIAASNAKALGVWCDFRTADTTEVDRKQIISDTMKIDDTPPTGTIVINSGADYSTTTTLQILITATDPSPKSSGIRDMRFSRDTLIWSDWENFSPTKTMTISDGDGAKKIYAELRDHADNVSTNEISDTIIIDTTKPASSVVSPSGVITNHILSIDWLSDDLGGYASGVQSVSIYWNKNGGAHQLLGTYPATITSTDFDTLPYGGAGIYGFYSVAQDTAGNIESESGSNDIEVTVQFPSAVEDWQKLSK